MEAKFGIRRAYPILGHEVGHRFGLVPSWIHHWGPHSREYYGGNWVVMSDYPTYYHPFESYLVGWIDYQTLPNGDGIDQTIEIPPFYPSGVAYRIDIPNTNDYYILHNMQNNSDLFRIIPTSGCCNLGDFNGDGKNEIIINNGKPFNVATVYTLADSMSVIENSHNEENNNLVISSYPNPFNKTIAISISLSHSNIIQLDIYNILGQKVKSIYNKRIERGDYVIQWDGRDNFGHLLANGVYFARLKMDNSVSVKKIVKIGQ